MAAASDLTLEGPYAAGSFGSTSLPADAALADVALQARLPVTLRVGATELPLSRILSLAPGDVIALYSEVGGPVDVLVAGKLVARGELVSIDGRLGVRIVELLPSEAE